VLIVLASAVPLVVAIAVMARPLDVGSGIFWYLFLQVAYVTWSPLTTSLTIIGVCYGLIMIFGLLMSATSNNSGLIGPWIWQI